MSEPVLDHDRAATSGCLAKHALTFGGIAGGVAAVCLVLEYAFGLHGEHLSARQYTTMGAFLIPIAGIALGVMRWRDGVLGGSIRFAQAFGCALAIGMVFALSFAAFSWLYATAINPGFIEALIGQQATVMQQAGSTPEEITAATTLARASATPGSYAFAIFTQMLVSAFLIALFASALVRRRT